VTTEDA
jgi:hypothetical protein